MTDQKAIELLRGFVEAVNKHDLITLGVCCDEAETLLAARMPEEPMGVDLLMASPDVIRERCGQWWAYAVRLRAYALSLEKQREGVVMFLPGEIEFYAEVLEDPDGEPLEVARGLRLKLLAASEEKPSS